MCTPASTALFACPGRTVSRLGRGDWGPLGHFSYFVKYFDFEKQDACLTYCNLLTIHSAT